MVNTVSATFVVVPLMNNDIIILIPGIGGSRLERGGKPIYDLSVGALPRLIWNWVGGDLAFHGGSSKPDDDVVATDLFNNQLIPGWFGVDDYDGLIDTLKGAVHDPSRQFFKFPYDWRASNRWAARALDAFARARLHEWQREQGGPDARLWLVCHSMGGLVARYFLEHLGGADITRRLITIATPHRGAPKALNALVNGMGFGPLDFSAVIRSFASTYELLPQAPVVKVSDTSGDVLARVADFFDMGTLLPMPATANPGTTPGGLTPLPHINAQRLREALEFHKKIREPVIRRMDAGEASPYDITCLFNRRQRTPQSALWQDHRLTLSDDPAFAMPAREDPMYFRGDGTVPGPSAVPIEWLDTGRAIAMDEKHVSMPSSKTLAHTIQNLANPLDTRSYMSDEPSDGSLGLAVPALVMAGQAFEIEMDAIRAARLTVTVKAVQSPAAAAFEEVITVQDRASARLELNLKEPGTYRVTARSADPLRPVVSDWVVVTQQP
jgi:pimeloyl-ACP methyl ester carboxylesterase